MNNALEPNFKRSKPDAWEEVLRVCEVVASVGHPPAVAARHLRHLGVRHPTLLSCINAGLIPAYSDRSEGSHFPDLSHLLR